MPSLRAFITICIAALLASSAFAQTSPEQPPWQACNETSFVLDIAAAHVPQDAAGTALVVTGWHRLRPGKCRIIAAKKSTPRYIYARSAPLHQGGIREWKGRHPYCVGDGDFTANTISSCTQQNLHTANFLRIIPTEERTAFVEPANYGKKAETAGLQRLLHDNNYDIKSIDGLGGRKTSKTLSAFLKANQIKANLSLSDKLAALEKSARDISQTVGVTLCNDSGVRIWSAVAFYSRNNWQSRGWWSVEPGMCARPITRSLKGLQAYIYARQDTDTPSDHVLKTSSVAGDNKAKNFCISEASFSAISHEYCQDQGYVLARFKALTNESTSAKITLTDSDFGKATLSGLR